MVHSVRLVVRTHHTQRHVWLLCTRDKSRDDGVVGPLAAANLVGVAAFQHEARAAIMHADTRARYDHTGAEVGVV